MGRVADENQPRINRFLRKLQGEGIAPARPGDAERAEKAAEAKKAEEKQLADIAKKKAEDEAKKAAEEEAKKQAAEDAHMTRKRSVCYRLATVFGSSPRPRTDLLINNLVGVASQKKPVEIFDGQFRRNYIHIDDLINALTFPLARQEMCGSTYNVGNDSLNMTKGDLIKEICRLVGGTWSEVDNRTDPDKRDYEVSSQKIYDVGFRCTRNLEYGVRQMQLVYANMKSEDAIKCKNY